MRLLAVLCLLPFLTVGQSKYSPQDYITTYKQMAIEEMERSGVPASITLAQGILESGSGNSELAKKARNHFGIKGHRNWTGECFYMDDDAENECFRVYKSVAESYADHSNFLHSHNRYAFLFELRSTDYKGWAKGLKSAGYATNPQYADIIIRLVEKYELHQYDAREKKRLFKPNIPDFFEINGTEAIAYDGQMTEREIRDKYFFATWQIYKYNDFKKGTGFKKGMVIYLKPKRNKNQVTKRHTVAEGENMQYISQLRGVKLKKLYRMNRMTTGGQPAVGEVLYLDETRENSPKLSSNANTQMQYFTVDTKTPPPAPEKTNEPEVAVKRPIKKEDGLYHKVAPGESLTSIARAYDLNWKVLKVQNNLKTNNIVVGQELLIKPYKELAIEIEQEDIEEDVPLENTNSVEGEHTVRKGETLFGIARLNGLTVAELMRLNSLTEPKVIEGQTLATSSKN